MLASPVATPTLLSELACKLLADVVLESEEEELLRSELGVSLSRTRRAAITRGTSSTGSSSLIPSARGLAMSSDDGKKRK